jgi:hypothetical protein
MKFQKVESILKQQIKVSKLYSKSSECLSELFQKSRSGFRNFRSSKKTYRCPYQNFATGYDPELISLYYQFGRYLLISSSQPRPAANLQGIWNNSNKPAWDSKYTININTEMNYWPTEKTNLPKCTNR